MPWRTQWEAAAGVKTEEEPAPGREKGRCRTLIGQRGWRRWQPPS
ncbi:MAG: hypothetical protein OXN96_09715 [Bryobacterales bacterium]|nr:hypothetical protein [Bryobacterales bacterium]